MLMVSSKWTTEVRQRGRVNLKGFNGRTDLDRGGHEGEE